MTSCNSNSCNLKDHLNRTNSLVPSEFTSKHLSYFRLALEGKTGTEISESSTLEILEKFLVKNFTLSDAEDNTSRLLNRGGIYSRFSFAENTISNSPKFPRPKFLGSDCIFCFIGICKSASFKNPFATITSLSKLYFRFRFILLVQTKKVISMNYGISTTAENHGNE